jgi:carbon monoxide dehydrogenase subunit G
LPNRFPVPPPLTIATGGRRTYFAHIGAKKPQVKRAFVLDFGGSYRLAAPRLAVWSALNDVRVLKATIPGCEHIDWVSENSLEMRIKVNLGVVHPVFAGDLVLSNVEPAYSYTLTGKGRGGLLGLAEGAADVTLGDIGESTKLSFAARGGASGRIMRLGRAVIGNSAQKVIDGFFERFAAAMGTTITPLE